MTETLIASPRDRVRRTFERRLPGRTIWPEDERYPAARTLWNAKIERRPAGIVQPRDEDEVATAVLCAREANLELAVRGGGHSLPGHSMSDGGITVDLSAFDHVLVDARARTARVGGGALLMDVATAAEPAGLALPFGHVSHTGVGGLTLGGGIGWIMRKYGLVVDSMRSARLVTADGQQVVASETENEDLFWAIRGGGGNFGVVTEFEFDLHPLGPEILAGLLLYPLEDAVEVLAFCRDFMDDAPRELTIYETFLTVPPIAPFPEDLQAKPAFGLGVVYAGPVDEASAVLRPLRAMTRPALDGLGPMTYTGVQTMLDDTAPHGMRNYSKSHWLRALPDEAIGKLTELHARVPSPMSLIIGARVGGAVADVPTQSTAFAHRGAYRLLWVVGAWWEGDDDEQIEWCRDVFDAMQPHSTGAVYVNALDADEGAERVRASYGDETWRRLVAVKSRWDADNVFRLNQNIGPEAAER
jgi:FAD/FMN-containing dehydrogenase